MERLACREVYAGEWLSVREDTVRRPDGSTGTYAVVDSADIVLVIPLEGDRVHLVEQWRHPVGGRRWELPSGSVDEGLDDDASGAAARELREETGLVAGELVALGTIEISPSTMSQRCTVFLATTSYGASRTETSRSRACGRPGSPGATWSG
jgi:8-oxo-dGTP pyrophosphatase MutT (NUDIX family)